MKNRLIFIDLLRGWATLVMIEVHVFNAFIVDALKGTGWFGVLNYINGLVAPAFLFVAGFVFVVASDRKLEEFRTFGKAFWKQLSRIGLIWVVGYGLHLPFFSLTRTLRDTLPEKWLEFFQSDILHCIAIGLLIVFLGRILIHSDVWYRWFLIGVGTFFVLVAPFIWDIDFQGKVPDMAGAYLNGQHFSLFPLFPWLGFLMFGAVAAFAHRQARAENSETNYFRRVVLVGAVLLVGGAALIELPAHIPFVSSAVRANPLFFASRLGMILLLLVACWYYAVRFKTERSFVLDVSKESLLVYTVHLLVIYGRFWNNRSLMDLYGGSFSIIECVAATLALALVMILMAQGWSWLKRASLSWSRVFAYATGLSLLIAFIIRRG